MNLTVNGKAYEIDRQALEKKFGEVIVDKVNGVTGELGMFATGAKGLIGAIMGHLGNKYPDMRRPDGMDNIEHAARSVIKMIFDEWDKHGIEVEAKETGVSEDVKSSENANAG